MINNFVGDNHVWLGYLYGYALIHMNSMHLVRCWEHSGLWVDRVPHHGKDPCVVKASLQTRTIKSSETDCSGQRFHVALI